jgi:hypothetical protein
MPINRLVNANHAPRCQHVKVSGARCGSPARHGRPYCCFHDSAARRNREFVLPIVEDAASLQLALNQILQAVVDKLIDQKTASILLYGLQIAFANLKQLKSEQFIEELQRLRANQQQEEEEEEEQEEEDEPDEEHQEEEIQAVADHEPDHPMTRSPDHPIPDLQACADPINKHSTACHPERSEGSRCGGSTGCSGLDRNG